MSEGKSSGLKLVLRLSKPKEEEGEGEGDGQWVANAAATDESSEAAPARKPPAPAPAPPLSTSASSGGFKLKLKLSHDVSGATTVSAASPAGAAPAAAGGAALAPGARKVIIKVAGQAAGGGTVPAGALDDEVELHPASSSSPRSARKPARARPAPAAAAGTPAKAQQKRTLIPVTALGDAPARALKQLAAAKAAAGGSGTGKKRRRAHSSDEDDDDEEDEAPLELDDDEKPRKRSAGASAGEGAGAGGGDGGSDSGGSDDESSRAPLVAVKRASRKQFMPLKKALSNVVGYAAKQDKHFMFYEPVDPAAVPDYHEVIKQPMCIATMRRKLAADEYGTMADLQADLDLMYDNAMLYNPPDNLFHQEAQRQKQELRTKLAGYLERFPQLRTESLHDPNYARHRKELEQKREAKRLQREEAAKAEEARRLAARQRSLLKKPGGAPGTPSALPVPDLSTPAPTAAVAAAGGAVGMRPRSSSSSSSSLPATRPRKPTGPGAFTYAAQQAGSKSPGGSGSASNFLTSASKPKAAAAPGGGGPAARPAAAAVAMAVPPVDAQADAIYTRSLEQFAKGLELAPVRAHVNQLLSRLRVPPASASRGRRDVSVAAVARDNGLSEDLLRLLRGGSTRHPPTASDVCAALHSLRADEQLGAAVAPLCAPLLAAWSDLPPPTTGLGAPDASSEQQAMLDRNFSNLYALQLLQLERGAGTPADAELRLVQALNDSLASLAARVPPEALLPVQLRPPPAPLAAPTPPPPADTQPQPMQT